VPDPVLSPEMVARYGTGHRSRLAIGVSVVVVLAFLAVITWIGYRMATPSVQAKLLAYTVVDDARVDVTFEVRRDSTSDTVCVLRARSASHVDVGYATVTITRGREYVQPHYRLATLGRATTAELLACAAGQTPTADEPAFAPGTTNPPQVGTIDGS
jgi:hypothetical protein